MYVSDVLNGANANTHLQIWEMLETSEIQQSAGRDQLTHFALLKAAVADILTKRNREGAAGTIANNNQLTDEHSKEQHRRANISVVRCKLHDKLNDVLRNDFFLGLSRARKKPRNKDDRMNMCAKRVNQKL